MVSPGEYSEYQLFLIDGDKRDSLSVENQTGLFSLQLDGDTSRIVTLMGVWEPGKISGRLNRHYILNREQKLSLIFNSKIGG